MLTEYIHSAELTRGPGEPAAVAGLLLQVADDGTLGHAADGQHVADLEGGLDAAVDEHAGVHALDGQQQLLARLVAVRVAEVDHGQRRATARVVDQLLAVGGCKHCQSWRTTEPQGRRNV